MPHFLDFYLQNNFENCNFKSTLQFESVFSHKILGRLFLMLSGVTRLTFVVILFLMLTAEPSEQTSSWI